MRISSRHRPNDPIPAPNSRGGFGTGDDDWDAECANLPGGHTPCARAERQSEFDMTNSTYPVAVVAADAPLRTKPSNYPEPFASRMSGRRKHPLGDLFGLTNFGVNLTRLLP